MGHTDSVWQTDSFNCKTLSNIVNTVKALQYIVKALQSNEWIMEGGERVEDALDTHQVFSGH